MMVLVVGATGLVGLETCRLLAEQGKKIRALSRRSADPAKRDRLRGWKVELVEGDLKDIATLHRACHGVDTVISTASATISRNAGDTIESVDHQGQLNLLEAAKVAAVKRFIYISFQPIPELDFPLQAAKLDVEAHIRKSGMGHTILRAGYFLEVWLSPAHGFDAARGNVRILGSGEKKVSWISAFDVAAAAASATINPQAESRVVPIAGDVASPNDVVDQFEQELGREIAVEKIPEADLRQQYRDAQDPLQRSFAALMLGYAMGFEIDPARLKELIRSEPVTIKKFARIVGASGLASNA